MKFELTSGEYKSLRAPLSWDAIPEFCVITGPNGAGKTQLLQLLARAATHAQSAHGPQAHFSGTDIAPHQVVHLEGWGLGNAELLQPMAVGGSAAEMVQFLRGEKASGSPLIQERIEALRPEIEAQLGRSAKEADASEVMALLPVGAVLRELRIGVMPNQISRVFQNHQISRIQLKAEGVSDPEIDRRIGERPWTVLNNLLAVSGVSYRLTAPAPDMRLAFQLALEDTTRKVTVQFGELSSGEMALMSIYLWLYTSSEHGLLPRLLLLDEPDAHLHPGMTRGFLEALHGTLVKQHGCRVIMTTHRPDTVAVVPQEALFEMFRDGVRIRTVESKEQTLGRLCSNLFTVIPGVRVVLVEDEDDVSFYKVVLRLAHDARVFPQEITPIFVAASTGKGASKDSGGKSKVSSSVRKLQAASLGKLVQGAVDRDGDAEGPCDNASVHTLPRYSFENFLADPLVIYAALLDAGRAPTVQLEKPVRRGEEAQMKSRGAGELQSIADTILSRIEAKLPNLSASQRERVDVGFGDLALRYPRWLLERKGKEVLVHLHDVYGPAVTQKPLLSAFERMRMLPDDLSTFLQRLI